MSPHPPNPGPDSDPGSDSDSDADSESESHSDPDPNPNSEPDLDALQTLSRREPILSALESEPRTKRALVDDLSVSRSTIDRAIRELEYFEFVERVGDRYRLTVPGRLALTEYRRRVGALDSIAAVSDLLGYVPCGAPMSVRVLDGATVREPEPHAPNEPFEAIVDRMAEADRVRGLAAAERVPRLRRLLHDRTVAGELEAEAVFTDELADFFVRTHARQLREMLDAGFDLYATPSIPYGLWIVDGPDPDRSTAFLVVHGDSADIRGVIRNDSPAALEWSDRVYREIRDGARRLEAPESE